MPSRTMASLTRTLTLRLTLLLWRGTWAHPQEGERAARSHDQLVSLNQRQSPVLTGRRQLKVQIFG